MLRQYSGKVTKKAKRGKTKFFRITQAAKDLCVERTHLYRVLIGERKSPLLGRYRAWKRRQLAANGTKGA